MKSVMRTKGKTKWEFHHHQSIISAGGQSTSALETLFALLH
jgi:hypothetical protein